MRLGSDLCFDRYIVDSQEEWLMRIGTADAPPILFVPPLFEELNRTRALIAEIMRNLARRGFGCWLPDLPGTGESKRPLEEIVWSAWREGARAAGETVAASTGRMPVVASLRGGCLIDDAVEASGHWRFAPAEGASLVRDLQRASLLAAGDKGQPISNLAGYPVSEALLEDIGRSSCQPVDTIRIVRLESDRAEADLKIAGPALWRRSEPGMSPALAEGLSHDLAGWCTRCAAS